MLSRRSAASTMLSVSALFASLSTSIFFVVSSVDMQLIQSFDFVVFAAISFFSFALFSTTSASVTSITNILLVTFSMSTSIDFATVAIRESYNE